MLGHLLLVILSLTTLLLADQTPRSKDDRDKPPQIVAVMKPEQTTIRDRSQLALDEFNNATGNSPCATQINVLTAMARTCLGNVSKSANGSTDANTNANRFWCQDPNGCRRAIAAPIRNVALACKPDDKLRTNAIQVMIQILYATKMACSESNESCDAQASLVNDMMLMNSDHPEFRGLACTPCVKKGFGRMSLWNSTIIYPGIYGKLQCNKINEKFCTLNHDPSPRRICEPCYQRSIAKKVSMDRLHPNSRFNDGQDDPESESLLLRACYDDGHGNTCLDRVLVELMHQNNITNLTNAEFKNYHTLKACQKKGACADKECQKALQTLVDRMGCCASAIPAALLGADNLSCLIPMAQNKTACNAPFTYMVTVTVESRESTQNLSRWLGEDLATTLATTSDLIACKPYEREDKPSSGNRTLMCNVRHYPVIGMPGTIKFDPDLLQGKIIDVRTSAVA